VSNSPHEPTSTVQKNKIQYQRVVVVSCNQHERFHWGEAEGTLVPNSQRKLPIVPAGEKGAPVAIDTQG